jgi:polyisoprenoid-binding protein YceI
MHHFDATSAECAVFTRKEGLLSAVAHDLQIAVTRFQIDVDADARTVDARFDARSLRVQHALQDGAPSPGALTDEQKREIEGSIVRHVLKADAHPEVRFVSTLVVDEGDGFRVRGALTLTGTTKSVDVVVRREDGRFVATARLHQPDFGIRPYSALLGALKVKADVEVRVSVSAPA